jgi:hypothetical protein
MISSNLLTDKRISLSINGNDINEWKNNDKSINMTTNHVKMEEETFSKGSLFCFDILIYRTGLQLVSHNGQCPI